jgi:hypothetical protein
MKCEEHCEKESGKQAYLWSFDCAHCGGEALIVTPNQSLIGSQGFCLDCGARYLYHHFLTESRQLVYYLAVSRPDRKAKKGKK